jgi:hypothetical protein
MTTMSRGIRNNNPGNIRLGEPWQGLAAIQTDDSFCQFASPQYGIRAIMKIMETYNSEGFNTITEIITKWAPPNENDTNAYVAAVSATSGIAPTVALNITDPIIWIGIIKSIILHENGQNPYTDAIIESGIKMALI